MKKIKKNKNKINIKQNRNNKMFTNNNPIVRDILIVL